MLTQTHLTGCRVRWVLLVRRYGIAYLLVTPENESLSLRAILLGNKTFVGILRYVN